MCGAHIDFLVRGMQSGIAVMGFGYIGAVLADCGSRMTGTDGRQTIVCEVNLDTTPVGMS